jgi:hypothetical protein
MNKTLLNILGAGAIALGSMNLGGCASPYQTPGLVNGMRAGEKTNQQTPYELEEIIIGTGTRAFVKKIAPGRKAEGLENHLPLALIPLEGSTEVINPSQRSVSVEGETYVLNSLGEQTVKILNAEGRFQDYSNPQEDINRRTNLDIGFRIPTITIDGQDFYRLAPQNAEIGKIALYLMPKKDTEILLKRPENVIHLRGHVYQPTKANIVDIPTPKPEPEQETPKKPTVVIGEFLSK